MWQAGQKVVRPYSPESGVGVIVAVEERFLDVFFPDTMERLKLSPEPESVRPIALQVGMLVRTPTNQVEQILELRGASARLSSGEEIASEQLWPVIAASGAIDRLLDGEFDEDTDVLNRLDGLRLLTLQHTGQVSSLLGGRIELFAHQLDTASQAIAQERARWLLADEVGLGKTIVAYMIASALLRTERVERAVILAPQSLILQWLGELYKKFHQVFVYVDEERLEHVASDFGEQTNPFDVHPLAMMSYEFLSRRPELIALMRASKPQLLIADEAHRLTAPDLHGSIAPLVREAEHALLLTATPFQLGERGFMGLVEMLLLEHSEDDLGRHVVRGVSAVTRQDIKRLPERSPQAIEVERVDVALSLEDERVAWLVDQIPKWRAEKRRALIFVNDASRAKRLTELLSRASHQTLFCFHEEMDVQTRDIELSRFRLSSSPAMVTSGAGSEGRNFQFCDLLVHLDLPEDPSVLEQRIGRLDRIGRTGELPIYYFVHGGRQGQLAKLYEELGVFSDASIGASPAMHEVSVWLERGEPIEARREAVVARTKEQLIAHDSAWLFPDSHQIEEGPVVMAQVPRDLEELTERFCTDAAQRVGLEVVEKDGEATYSFEHGSRVVVDVIPGVEPEAHYLGTFSREEAIGAQELDFFSSGHVLVEGLLAELEDSDVGTVGALQLRTSEWRQCAPKGFEQPGLYLLLHEGEADLERQSKTLYGVAGERAGERVELNSKQLLKLLEGADQARSVGREYAKQTARALNAADFSDQLGARGELRLALAWLISN